MVQREVADRFFADPSTKAYGAVSVLVQLVTEKTGFHPVSRTVFRPQPNVDSALVAFSRTGLPEAYADVKAVVEAAFAHRRKTLPNSLELSGLASRGARDGSTGGDRPAAGHPCRGARAARVRRPGRGTPMSHARATAKINLALVVGPRREDGKHEVATVLQRIDLADGISLAPGPSLEIDRLSGRHARPRRAAGAGRGGGVEPHWTVEIEKRIPVGSGLGGGSSDAAAALRLANETLPAPLAIRAFARDRGRDRRRRSLLPDRRARSSEPATAAELEPLDLPARLPDRCSCCRPG